MRKSSFIAALALMVALVGIIVALAAYFKRRQCILCDDFEEDILDPDDDLDYYSTQLDDFDDEPLVQPIEVADPTLVADDTSESEDTLSE